MKSLTQAVVTVAVLIGGVFGLTYLTQFTRTPKERPADPAQGGEPVYALRVPEKVALWDADEPTYAAEYEKNVRGHYDFWVSNPNPKPVRIGVKFKSCTCTEVQLGTVPAAEWAVAQSRQAALATALNLLGAPNLAGLASTPALLPTIQWQPLVYSGDPVPVGVEQPAADPKAGPQLSIIRLTWERKDIQPIRLSAEIQHQIGDSVDTTRFEVPVNIVPPIIAEPHMLHLNEMKYGEQRQVTLYVWSATRPELKFTVEESRHDPCFEIQPPRPLSDAEKKALPREFVKAGLIPALSKMRCGYAVDIKVYENRGGHHLELGPLERKLVIKPEGIDGEGKVFVSGLVRGIITIGEAGDRDRIDLGNFRASSPTEKTVTLSAPDPNLKLQLVSHLPENLVVNLEESPASFGVKRWKLTVGVAPHTISGVLPSDSAVYLQTLTTPPRRIRIPVLGNATH